MYDLGMQFHIDTSKLYSKPDAIIKGDKYRFTVLTERLIRLEYSENSIFNDEATQFVCCRDFDVPKFEIKEDANYLELKTSYFTLLYIKESNFKEKAKNLNVKLNNTENIWYYGHPEAKNYLGSNISIETSNDKDINKGLYSLDGFVSIDDSNTLRLDKSGNVVPSKNNIDIYLFMYDKDFGYCLQDYFKLTGYPPLIPRYALGNWWCKDEVYTDKALYELISMFDSQNIPLSVLMLGKNWSINKGTGYTFDNNLFPEPKQFVDVLHSRGIRVGLRIDPSNGITANEANYNTAIQYIAPNDKSVIEFQPFDPKFLKMYFNLFINPLENYGIDFFWNDYKDIKNLNKLWIMNHYHCLDLEKNKSKRGMVLSRNSLFSAHKYPILYSGETKVSWDNFKELPFFNISSANIGVCWWSHDIGGYSGGTEEEDLYIRSVQLGVFSPILRFNSKGGKYYKKEPWKWSYKTKNIVCNYLQMRHRLISYLYSEAYRYHKYGKVVFQPIYYLIPKLYDDLLYRNEYFFGSELLVAPIINKKEPLMNRTIHRFYLPNGIWYDYVSGKKFLGNKKYVAFFKEEEYPVFAKQGAIIPLSNKSNINNTGNPTNLEIQIFPGKSNTFELYEDDGVTTLYKENQCLMTSIEYNYMPNNYTIIIRSLFGRSDISPEYRNYKIRLRNSKQANEVVSYFNNGILVDNKSYVEGNDFIIEINNIKTVGQLTVNCKGSDMEIDAARLINEDISSILMDLVIETELKEEIDKILFSELSINKKRVSLKKLKRKGLDKTFVTLFIKLLEYIEQI